MEILVIHRIATATWIDSVRFNVFHLIPYYLQGVFTRNPFFVGIMAFVRLHPFSARFGSHLKRKYGGDLLYIRVLVRKSLLVLSVRGIKHVLEHSPAIYAEPRFKRRGVKHFQPNSVTISRGHEWQDRRQFNEAVLNSDRREHQHAGRFLEVIANETAGRPPQSWDDFDSLFGRIALKIIFGLDSETERELLRDLKAMMRLSNRVLGLRKSRLYDRFIEGIRWQLLDPRPGSLASMCAGAPSTTVTKPENQLTHWMFAISETLAENTVRALAVLVAHPEALKRVQAELSGVDLTSAQAIDQLHYLEGCVQEAMRLWPTTPLLIRETTQRDTCVGLPIPAQTQVLIVNGFNHRGTEADPQLNAFRPQMWMNGTNTDAFNHFSNGTQVCAGKHLALFVAKAVIAMLLDGNGYVLRSPKLKPEKPMPETFNIFRVRFARTRERKP